MPTPRGQLAAPALIAAAPLLAMGSAIAAFYSDVLQGRAIFTFSDMARVYLPARTYLAERLRRGELPEWYPWDGLGGSLPGHVVTGIFHPSALLHLLFAPAQAIAAAMVLAHALAGLGTYLLLRRWRCGGAAALAGGLAFAFSGYLVSMDKNLPYLLSGAAIPWALFGAEAGPSRGWAGAALAAASLASMALAGDPQTTLIGSALLAAAAAFPAPPLGRSASLRRVAAAFALAAAAAAMQVLPGLASAGLRDSGPQALADARALALNPLRLIELLAPGPLRLPDDAGPAKLFGLQRSGQTWADTIFVGPAALALALAALWGNRRREARLLAAAAAASLALALGTPASAPGYALAQRFVPLWSSLRFPEKSAVFAAFALAGLAGLGAQAVLEDLRARRAALLGAALSTSAAAMLGAAASRGAAPGLWLALAGADESAAAELAQLLAGLAPRCAAAALLGLLGLAALALARSGRPWAGALMALCIGAEAAAGTFAVSRRFRGEPAFLYDPPASARELRRRMDFTLGAARIYAKREAPFSLEPLLTSSDRSRASARFEAENLAAGSAALYGFESAEGFLPLTASGRSRRALAQLPRSVYLAAFNTRFRLELDPDAARLEEAFRVRELAAGTRVRLARAVLASSETEAIAIARSEDFDALGTVVVEAADFPTTAPEADGLKVLRYEPELVEVEAWTGQPCALFVADAFAPGWTATVDGRPAAIAPADVAGRAIALSAGQHHVELRFRAPGLRAGLAVSLVGWAILALVALAALRRFARNR